MSTETFLRLPEEKRARILDAAWEEFTTVPFASASVNQIVRRAGIPRGSFYQYFNDKTDLFACLMEDIREEMTEAVRDLLKDAGGDLFRMAVLAYDGFAARRADGASPLLNRLLSLMRINPKIDMEGLVKMDPEPLISEVYLREMDLSLFRRQDRNFILRVCRLTGFTMIGMIMDSLCFPEHAERNREELTETLDIIRRGSLTEAALREGGTAS